MHLAGQIFHQRLQPLKHGFRYPAWYSVHDLDQPHPFKVRRHLSPEDTDLATKARAEAAKHHIDASGRIRMLAQPSVFGIGFNPLSVYYCENAQGEPSGLLLEVRNTPWREREVYALACEGNLTHEWAKSFHVSPFNPAGQRYRIEAEWPNHQFRLRLELIQNNEVIFHAGFQMKPVENRRIRDQLGAMAMPLITVGGIYWQALKLWCKGLPYQPYPTELKK